ncbi:MAG: ankyrin repeat domain-containing protein [Wolbachia sp.]
MNEIQQKLNKQLFSAVVHCNVGQIEKLIVAGADVNTPDALHLAAHKGYIKIITLLLANGANVNQMNVSGCTPLHVVIPILTAEQTDRQ